MSASTVRRWLAQDALKPWQHRSWTFITSPGSWLKAAWVLHLYALTWQGEQLGDDEYVISPVPLPPQPRPGKARARRVNHTYGRGGAPAYLAATTSTPRRCSATPTPATTRRSPAWVISSRLLQESEPEEPA
ncbi:hypothetical protein [Streptomyces sp. NPDC057284]|uniref:hypothetical protein n=1 Tax=Streptomyces sp. NPDC057284 TaxID=3346083 RepID=UPI00363D7186